MLLGQCKQHYASATFKSVDYNLADWMNVCLYLILGTRILDKNKTVLLGIFWNIWKGAYIGEHKSYCIVMAFSIPFIK